MRYVRVYLKEDFSETIGVNDYFPSPPPRKDKKSTAE